MELSGLKQLIEAFKAARKTEIILIAAALCALFLCLTDGSSLKEAATEEEKRIQHILSQIEGAGKVHVMLSEDESGLKQGAVVAAAGAERIEVMLELQQVMHTLTGLELDRIEVVKSKR